METKIMIIAAGGVLIGANLIAAVLIWAYKRLVNPGAKGVLGKILTYVDEFCDNVEKPAERAKVILALQSVLGFGIAGKKIYLPTVIVGWILDAEVKVLRWLGVPNLHDAEVKPDENLP